MKRLVNSDVEDILEDVASKQETLQKALYEQYKNVYELSMTNSFRGEGAKAYKSYLTNVSINYINTIINVSAEVTEALRTMKDEYLKLESNESGSIDTDKLCDVQGYIGDRKNNFTSLADDIISIDNDASNLGVTIEALGEEDIESEYDSIKDELSNISTDLDDTDKSASKTATSLMDRITEVSNCIKNIMDNYHSDGKIKASDVDKITSESWYNIENDDNLYSMMQNDPFAYSANEGYLLEDQWAKGLTSDVYGYAGYRVFGGNYDFERRNGVISANGKFVGAEGYANGQFTKYLRGSARASFLDVSGKGKMGWSDKYKGLALSASGTVAHADASTVLGSDACNVYASADANALSAKGHVECDFKEDGQFDVGIGGKASLADASVSAGTSFLSVKSDTTKSHDDHVSTTTSIFGVKVTAKASLGGEADASISTTKVKDIGDFHLNTAHIKLKAVLGIGGAIDLTVPYIGF